mgnify:CR=1 FL=1
MKQIILAILLLFSVTAYAGSGVRLELYGDGYSMSVDNHRYERYNRYRNDYYAPRGYYQRERYNDRRYRNNRYYNPYYNDNRNYNGYGNYDWEYRYDRYGNRYIYYYR